MKLEVALTFTTISIPILHTRMAWHQYEDSPYCSLYISFCTDNENFFKIKASEVVIIFFILMI